MQLRQKKFEGNGIVKRNINQSKKDYNSKISAYKIEYQINNQMINNSTLLELK